MNDDDHRTIPLGSICPQCGQAPTREDGRCEVHPLYAVAPGELAHLRKAPLLGHLIERRYALIGYIGAGGMGAIYRARQLGVDRDVAFKYMHGGQGATPSARERFKREARVVASLQSDHTVRLYDFGQISEGPLCGAMFMVMDLVEGISLARRLRIGPMPLDEIALLLAHVADSVDEAHLKGIIHRDLKPSNILLTAYHGHPRAKVIDFGIARVEDSEHTLNGTTLGTPGYMAPELWPSDDPRPPTGQIDVYAMGVVLYQMLTGVKPFRSRDLLTLFDCHVNRPVPSLAGGDPILAQLEPVVLRAMEKRPEDRHESLAALARDFSERLAAAAQQHDTESLSVPFQTPSGRAEITTRESRSGSSSLAIRGMVAPTPTETHVDRRRPWLGLAGALFSGVAAALLVTALFMGWIPLPVDPPDPGDDPRPAERDPAPPPVRTTEGDFEPLRGGEVDGAGPTIIRVPPMIERVDADVRLELDPVVEPPRPRPVEKRKPRDTRPPSKAEVRGPTAPEPAERPSPTRTLISTWPDADVATIERDLAVCRCAEARAALTRLERADGDPAVIGALRDRIGGCNRRLDPKTGACGPE